MTKKENPDMTTATLTPVVVATHAEGVVRLYYRTADGALNQTGQLVAQTVEPTALATLAADLSDALGWEPVPTVAPRAKTVKESPKPLPAKAKTFRNRPRAGREEMARRNRLVLDYLTEHGATSVPALARTLFADIEPKLAEGVVRKCVLALNGQLTRTETAVGKADLYQVTPVPETEPEHTPGLRLP